MRCDIKVPPLLTLTQEEDEALLPCFCIWVVMWVMFKTVRLRKKTDERVLVLVFRLKKVKDKEINLEKL